MKGDIIILGGGISGLSTAFHLGRTDVPILEMEEVPGGLCRSDEIKGYTFDRAPHILFPADPYTEGLIRDLLGDNLLAKERAAFIFHDACRLITRFPFQAHLYGLPVDVVRDCLVGLFEAYADPNPPPTENYRDWILRTFGKGIAEHLMFPYAEKLWTVPPETMNYAWIKRRVPTPPIREIVTGALTETTRPVGFNNTYSYPKRGGVQALVKALAAGQKEIRVKAEVTAVDPDARTIEVNGGERIPYARVVSTLPLPAFIPRIRNVPEAVRRAAAALEHNSVFVVTFGVERENISPMDWCYFYEKPFPFHRVSLPVNFSPFVAPPGRSVVQAEIAYSKHRPMSRDGLIDRVRAALVHAGILRADDVIDVTHLFDLHFAYIIYDHHHAENVQTIHAYLNEIGIIPCGRFAEWEYFNVDHSLNAGKRAAEKVLRG